MKTTIDIADDLFEQAQQLARQQRTTFRALTEQGLRLVLKEERTKSANWKWKPVIVPGRGLSAEFRKGGWEKVRDAIYRGRGA